VYMYMHMYVYCRSRSGVAAFVCQMTASVFMPQNKQKSRFGGIRLSNTGIEYVALFFRIQIEEGRHQKTQGHSSALVDL
jgi:hypothetical protein